MSKDIFSGLENLGFNDTENLNLFNDKEDSTINEKKAEQDDKEKIKSSLYEKEIQCPVCTHSFKAKAVKCSTIRIDSRDSDTFIRYASINPYFYNVWICPICGYSNMEADFFKIRERQKDLIRKNISPKWHGKTYPEIYDVNIAIERFKLSLYNSVVYGADSSQKAITCLKIAWMYRLMNDFENEKTFIEQALKGFNDAYMNEHFPIYKMDQPTILYLMGELSRRIDKNDEALSWFGKLITMPGANQKIKERARDQRDLIKKTLSDNDTNNDTDNDTDTDNNNDKVTKEKTKKGFFSKFFK